jgi:adenylate kinase
MRWIILGPPGSGKGTQAKKLAQAHEAVHLSTGDILRAEVALGSDVGNEAKRYMEVGELVPDVLIIRMIRTRLEQEGNGKGFILDGFPRTRDQAEELDIMLKEIGATIDRAVLVKVGDEEVKKRLIGRSAIEGRTDDTDEVIERRLQVYRDQTKPVVDYYQKKGCLTEVEGEQTIDDVYRDLEKLVAE